MQQIAERRAVSQSAIAREAGVARTTVSLALRGGEGLNHKTIERVMNAADALGYRPNNLVHAIRSGRTRMIGVMVPPSNSFWSDVLHGIHDGLTEHDYVPLALWSQHQTPQMDEVMELRQIERLMDWRVDGAILWPWFANLYRTHISDLKRRDLPLVTIDSMLPDSFRADVVRTDEAQGAEVVVEHLLSQGHKEILHFAGPNSESWARDRRSCFAEVLRRTPGVKPHFVEVPNTNSRRAHIREALDSLESVTAVFCATDEIAEDVYREAAALGKRIPEDLSVVGFGNESFGSRLTPELTTVKQKPYSMGLAAARMIITRIEQTKPVKPKMERMPVEFVPRMSTAAARGRDTASYQI